MVVRNVGDMVTTVSVMTWTNTMILLKTLLAFLVLHQHLLRLPDHHQVYLKQQATQLHGHHLLPHHVENVGARTMALVLTVCALAASLL